MLITLVIMAVGRGGAATAPRLDYGSILGPTGSAPGWQRSQGVALDPDALKRDINWGGRGLYRWQK